MINRKRLFYIILLSLWAFLQFTWGDKLYILFIIMIFLLLILNRPPRFMLVAGLVLAIVLFTTPTIATWTALQQSNLHTVQNLESSLTNIIIPNSGKEALPKKVQRMLELLHTHHIASYRLSNRLEQDIEIKQRITESAWPIKMESTSPYLLVLVDEINNYSPCTEIGQKKDVALVYCP